MDPNLKTPSLRIRPLDVSACAMVVGDPERAAFAAALMEDAREIGSFREYRTFTGVYKGKRITVSSHGVGSTGANICFHELFQCGVQTIIRAGTCGAMQPGIADGDLIIGTGAIREDGASEHLASMAFPAIADRHVTDAIEQACRNHGIPNPHTGIILSQACFYPGLLPDESAVWMKTGLAAAVEMEYAVLLIMASLKKVRAGGIFTSDGNLTEEPDPDSYNPHRPVVDEGKKKMLLVTLEALANLSD
jgi:uridine phosphorylase